MCGSYTGTEKCQNRCCNDRWSVVTSHTGSALLWPEAQMTWRHTAITTGVRVLITLEREGFVPRVFLDHLRLGHFDLIDAPNVKTTLRRVPNVRTTLRRALYSLFDRHFHLIVQCVRVLISYTTFQPSSQKCLYSTNDYAPASANSLLQI